MCSFVSTVVPQFPGQPNSPYRAEVICTQHQMPVPEGTMARLCPIGKIEEARDAALRDIALAAKPI